MTGLVAPVPPVLMVPGFAPELTHVPGVWVVVGLGLVANLLLLGFTLAVNLYTLGRVHETERGN